MNRHTPNPGLTLAISNPAKLMHGCTAYHRFTRQGGSLGGQQCDWHLQDRAQRIHPRHCEVCWREDGFCVIDHSGQTYLNGNDLSLRPVLRFDSTTRTSFRLVTTGSSLMWARTTRTWASAIGLNRH
ncbi:FHA domain-containing protein [Pseudomonas sp. MAFF212428]|uniref:FHA domain-containing protein n=1 Tax=Pseudomonas brassicae TaxID=2708063 RepID=A0A6M0CYF6_9PSED|nr:FHA domain-containing protein [Pseudomonas brassicae]